MRLWTYAFVLLTCLALPVAAQETEEDDSGGFLVRFLEDTLSDDSRTVRVTGLEGALSSRATIQEIAVSDDDGVWLTLTNAVLDWNRVALVRGRFSINELTAESIVVARQPLPSTETDLPPPEAQPFALPELPVSVEISKFAITRVELGETVVGLAAAIDVAGALTLADGALDADIAVTRLDKPGDEIKLLASYANDTRQIGLDLKVTEDRGGLISTVLGLPGRPTLALSAVGDGPVDDFGADLKLATEGIDRIEGRIELSGDQTGDTQAIGFTAEISGDVTPLLAPEFARFFGTETRFDVTGQSFGDGRLSVDALSVTSEALRIAGDFALNAAARPSRLNLTAAISPVSDGEVVLPISGARTAIRGLSLNAQYDAEIAEDWTVDLDLTGLSRPDVALDQVRLAAFGTASGRNGDKLSGQIDARLTGLAFPDPALQSALGPQVSLVGGFSLPGNGTLTLSDFEIRGDGYRAQTQARISDLNSGFQIDGKAAVEADDLSQFSALAGQPIGGTLTASLTGSGAPLGGGFDLVLDGVGGDLRTGMTQLDDLLGGETRLTVDAGRGPSGLTIREITLGGTALTARIDGTLRSQGTELNLRASLDDLGRVLPDLPGPVTVAGTVQENKRIWNADLTVDAPGGANVILNAKVPLDPGADVALDLALAEPAGGPVGQLLGLPGAPAVALTVVGAGPLDDFAADLSLATNMVERLTGQVTVRQSGDDTAGATTAFTAQLGGDITALVPREYHAFFGPHSDLDLTGTRAADGALELEELHITSRALSVDGSLAVTPAGLPNRVFLRAAVTPETGQDDVQLPVPGDPMTVRGAGINVEMNTDISPDWKLGLTVDGLAHSQFLVSRLAARANGQIDLNNPMTALGVVKAGIQGLSLADQDLQAAIGPTLSLDGEFELPGDDTLALSDIKVQGAGFTTQADAVVRTLSETPVIEGSVTAELSELERFSGLAGHPLSGQASATLKGSATPSSRQFDVLLTALLRDLRTGIAQADAVLPGDTNLALSVQSRVGGVTIDRFAINGTALTARASGALGSTGTDMKFMAALDDMGRVLPELPGRLRVDGNTKQSGTEWIGTAYVDAPNKSFVDLKANVTPGGAAYLHFDAEMKKLERFLPEFPGVLSANGTASRENQTWQVEMDAAGPADISAAIDGSFDETTGVADMTAQGNVLLAAANTFISPMSVKGNGAFDLALRGKPALESLSGQISASNTSIAIPQVQNSIQNFGGSVTLDQGQATLAFAGDVRTGGGLRISGPVELKPPFNGNVVVDLLTIVLTDQLSYNSSADGQITYSGPLVGNGRLSGRIDIGETEINIANAGGVSSAPIPPMAHKGEPGAVQGTRARAGLIEAGKAQSDGPDIGLDIEISAPNRIFVRGRGLDSELGGNIFIRGSTQNLAPSGQIELIRGFLEIFGRRLDLSKGLVTLQGSLAPFLDFAATSNTQDGTATLEITGEPDDLEINIYSDPERTTEEALAMLVFGNQFSKLSPLKIAQLATSLAKLRGGGDGLNGSARDATGADSVSLAEDSGGNPSLGLGGYVAENVYTDLSVNTRGDTELNINLGVTDNLTLKGSVDNTGQSALGIFFEREY